MGRFTITSCNVLLSEAAVLADCRPVPRGDGHEHHDDDEGVVDETEQPEDELGQDVERREEVDEDDLVYVVNAVTNVHPLQTK